MIGGNYVVLESGILAFGKGLQEQNIDEKVCIFLFWIGTRDFVRICVFPFLFQILEGKWNNRFYVFLRDSRYVFVSFDMLGRQILCIFT